MAESVVMLLIAKLECLIETEVRPVVGIREEIVRLKVELECMKAFLRDADTLEDEDQKIKLWVKHVRDLAHDAEDIIDEFLLQFEHPRRSGFTGSLLKIARAIKSLTARCQVASKLRLIKSRATCAFELHQRYQHEWRSGERGSKYGAKSYAEALNERRNDARLVPEARLVGTTRPRTELVDCLLADTARCKVVAVWGMGGLGKTTIVNQVYQDARVKQYYHHRAWITVSQSFDVQDLLLKITKQLPIPEDTHSMDLPSLKEFLYIFLSDKKYLIVLDDVWTTESWESLKNVFPDNYGSRLIVTTRDSHVADTITKDLFTGMKYPLSPLTEKESWNLFCARVFQGQPCPRYLEDISRRILERCKGLPLGIVAISGLLSTKVKSPEEWERVRRSMGAEPNNNDQLRDMQKILSLSFDDLPYDLKSCFMYLSMFPEDFSFYKEYIIDLWIAEGFVQKLEDMTPEELGDLYFKELRNRSLIQVTKEDKLEGDFNMFQVHDLIRDTILQKSSNQSFSTIINEQSLVVPKGVRRLFLADASLENIDGSHNLSRLRTLIFLNSKRSSSSNVSELEFLHNRGVRLLKVLDCSSLSLDTFPSFITRQYNLRYLSLFDSKVKSIPRSIKRLRNLVMLDLRGTLVEELPSAILEIHGLRHILATCGPNSSGVRVPPNIGMLTSLQTLFTIRLSGGGLDLIKSLGKLKQLRTLEIEHVKEEHGSTLCSSIEQHIHLRTLSMESINEDEILDVQHISSPPAFIKHVAMTGCLSKLPDWVSNLDSLVELKLKWSKLKGDALECLQALPNLLHLYFDDNAYDGEELCFRAKGFQMLKHLWFTNSCRLRRIEVEQGSMPQLRELWLNDCKLLEEVPSGIEFLTNLKELHLLNVGDQLITRIRSTSEDSDFHKIKHVPTLVMGSLDAEGGLEEYL